MTMEKLNLIPQTDPKASYFAYKDEIDESVRRVLESGYYILGSEVKSFELEFANYIGVKYAIGVGNGTNALELALRACGVGQGDIVFTVSHTAVATVAAIELVGATPVFIDIDLITYTLDPDSLKEALECKLLGTPKAIIPVHLYGHPADMETIKNVAKIYGLYVIEDCAQSHGAVINGRKTGTWGDLAAFSFYPTKNLGALGDGGMVVTNNSALAEKVCLLQQYGWRNRYISDIPGNNSRLDEIQAAVLRVKLRHLDNENNLRRIIAQKYIRLISEVDNKLLITLPKLENNVYNVYHQFVIRSSKRDEIKKYLQSENISTIIHYPLPVHLQPAYKDRLNILVPLLVSENISNQVLSLPMYPQMSELQIEYVVKKIADYIKE